MSKRNQIHVEIESLTQKLSATNELLSTSNDLSMLDIDLLRKNTIEIYDLVNNLRLVMHETIPAAEKSATPIQPDFEEARKTEEERLQEEEEEEREKKAEELRLQVDAEEKERKAEELRQQEEAEEREKKAQELRLQAEAEEKEAEEQKIKAEEEKKKAQENEPKNITQENSSEEKSIGNEFSGENLSASVENQQEEELVEEEKTIESIAETPAQINETNLNKPKLEAEESEPQDLAGKFSATPINDLKKAISIAKKFEFINTLFQGNVEKYAYSIHFLNGLESGDEAFTELNKLRVELEWEEEDRNYMELANLVRRRYLG